MPDSPPRTLLQAEAAKQEAEYLFERGKVLADRLHGLRSIIQNPDDQGLHRVTDEELQGWVLSFIEDMSSLYRWQENVVQHLNKNRV